MAARTERFPRVHALRGLAALSVLLYHAAFKAYLLDHPRSPLAPYAAHLDVGVSIFFLISGFVLYRPMVAARLAGGPPLDPERYGRRRLARIVPGYWVALLLAGVAGASYAGYPAIFDPQGAVAYFGFLQVYSPDTAAGGINVAWTLCIEVTFYAFLPLWARFGRGRSVRAELAALAALFAASLVWQVAAVHATDPGSFGLRGTRWLATLPGFLDQFAVGMAIAVASVAWRPRRVRPWIPLVAGVVAFWILSTRIGLHGARSDELTPLRYVVRHQLMTAVALCVLVAAVFSPQRAWRPLAAAGTISYGIYLYHVPVMVLLGKWRGLPDSPAELALWLALAVPVTFVLASLSWRLVERPAMRWGARRAEAPAVAPAVPEAAG
jgi:peptidoglycan/LPS O-acetylase OafA/YrhL